MCVYIIQMHYYNITPRENGRISNIIIIKSKNNIINIITTDNSMTMYTSLKIINVT